MLKSVLGYQDLRDLCGEFFLKFGCNDINMSSPLMGQDVFFEWKDELLWFLYDILVQWLSVD